MQIQILKDELSEWYHQYTENIKVNEIDYWKAVSLNSPVVCSGDLLNENVRTWLNQKQPAFYVGRGYIGNHLEKQRKFFRVSINSWANTKLFKVPYRRWESFGLEKHPWKVKEVKKVLIAPSKMTAKIWTPDLKDTWAESMLDKFSGAEVRIRIKARRPNLRWMTLWDDFDWADLVVSQSSAITCEAFWYGKKVISLYPCPTWAAQKTTLDDWQDPKEPELRDDWHEHLAWSQYTVDEWNSGSVLHHIQSYLGNVHEYDAGYNYNFANIV